MHVAKGADRHLRMIVERERQIDARARPSRRQRSSPACRRSLPRRAGTPASPCRQTAAPISFSTAATPSSVVVWMSWPQACIRPGFVLANGSPDFSSIGSASMSARMASTGPGRPPSIRPTTPVRADAGLVADAETGQFARDDAGSAHLLEAEFGMGMDVAADFDQCRLDALCGVADRGGRVIGEGHGWAFMRCGRHHVGRGAVADKPKVGAPTIWFAATPRPRPQTDARALLRA